MSLPAIPIYSCAAAAWFLTAAALPAASPDKSSNTAPEVVFDDASRRGVPYAKDPSVIKFQGRYLMYYSLPDSGTAGGPGGWGIGVAASTDLRTWKKIGEVLPVQPAESKGICAPGARVIRNQVHLFYQTYGNGRKDAICHAVSNDGLLFERDPSNPVFRPQGQWSVGRAIDAEICIVGDRALLYYATRDPQMKRQMLGVAAAPAESDFSQSTWTDLSLAGPMLEPQLPWELDCIEAASICARDGRLFLFYAGGYNNSPQQIGVASGTDGLHWTRLSEKPLLPNGPAGSWNSSESGHPGIFVDDDGSTYLFYQGNNTIGKTWSIGCQRITWQDGLPTLSTAHPKSPSSSNPHTP